jgi:flagellar hook protein FlgE
MRLESALFTSSSGIGAHGQAISVVGDNIANVSTTGFKTSRPEFSDIFAEGGDGRQSVAGPVTGNGVKLTTVRQLHETGIIEPTGRELDAGIEGKGFFIVGDAENPEYTRAGNFSVNEEGLLVNSDGKTVLGYQGSSTTLGTLNLKNVSTTGKATTASAVYGNLSSESPVATLPQNPTSFRELGRAASYTANSSVYDSLGAEHTITTAFFKTGVNTWTAQAYIDGDDVGGTNGVPVKLGQDVTLQFNTTGVIDEANRANARITATPAFSGGAAPGNFTIDLSGFSQFAAANQLVSITQDGEGTGQIDGYEIQKNGTLQAVMDNGNRVQIGTIVVANFANVNGLQRSGSSTFVESQLSGARTVDAPGKGINGELSGGALERSTVDISNQFVDLILLQRGYEANSQILSGTNEMLRNTIQLIR